MRAAVLGHPIAHSLSPVLHRAAYAALGLDWAYDAIDVTEDELPRFWWGLDDSWAGLSLTMPLKAAVLPLLDDVSSLVRRVGAANTVVFADGRRVGHNTDVAGIQQAVREVAGGFRRVGIVGGGSTAAAALIAADALATDQVVVSARRPAAAAALVSAPLAALSVPTSVLPWARLDELLTTCDCVVVTLPGDAAAGLVDLVPRRPGLLLDVTYHPWPTTLARAWVDRGGTVAPGSRMLLWQAVAQVELMTGRAAPTDAMAAALTAALNPERGITHPGSGHVDPGSGHMDPGSGHM